MEKTTEELDTRLCRVIAQADTTYLDDDYFWTPLAHGEAPRSDSIACVRDGASWHQFVPDRGEDRQGGRFKVVCFRFAEDGPSAIGFIGWLHSHLRTMGQTAAIVICGKDVRDTAMIFDICQGVMDYWASPVGPTADSFLNVIRTLIVRGGSL